MNKRIGLVLLGMAVAQAAFLGHGFLRREPEPLPYRTLAVGDTVRALTGSLDGGPRGRFSLVREDGRPTVVLGFKSTCPFCEKAAPVWRDWLRSPHGAEVVAVSREPMDTARAYRDRHGWRVQVLSVEGADRYTPERLLVARIPWVAIFDSRGVLRMFEPGGSLARTDSALARIAADGVGHSSKEVSR
jgi:peroxiredoxin